MGEDASFSEGTVEEVVGWGKGCVSGCDGWHGSLVYDHLVRGVWCNT